MLGALSAEPEKVHQDYANPNFHHNAQPNFTRGALEYKRPALAKFAKS